MSEHKSISSSSASQQRGTTFTYHVWQVANGPGEFEPQTPGLLGIRTNQYPLDQVAMVHDQYYSMAGLSTATHDKDKGEDHKQDSALNVVNVYFNPSVSR